MASFHKSKPCLSVIQMTKRLFSDDSCDSKPPPSKESKDMSNVTGLSNKVLIVCDEEVGPGASKCGVYKIPEYFSFHKMSYYEAIVELNKHRLPQPNAHRK